jgi:hypothetical protein
MYVPSPVAGRMQSAAACLLPVVTLIGLLLTFRGRRSSTKNSFVYARHSDEDTLLFGVMDKDVCVEAALGEKISGYVFGF